MHRILVAAAIAACATSAHADGHGAPSTFQLSCSYPFVDITSGDAVMTAICLDEAGAGQRTSLTLLRIDNNDGMLVPGEGAATFHKSCGSIDVTTDVDGATLSAICRTNDGGFNATSIGLVGIGNANGELVMN